MFVPCAGFKKEKSETPPFIPLVWAPESQHAGLGNRRPRPACLFISVVFFCFAFPFYFLLQHCPPHLFLLFTRLMPFAAWRDSQGEAVKNSSGDRWKHCYFLLSRNVSWFHICLVFCFLASGDCPPPYYRIPWVYFVLLFFLCLVEFLSYSGQRTQTTKLAWLRRAALLVFVLFFM